MTLRRSPRRLIVAMVAALVAGGCAGQLSPELDAACGGVARVKQALNDLAELEGDVGQLGAGVGTLVRRTHELGESVTAADHDRLAVLTAQLRQEVATVASTALATADGHAAAAQADPTVQDMITVCREVGAY